MNIDTHAVSHDPAAALRLIGQELADLLPLILEIEVKDDQFVVTGRGLPEPVQTEGAGQNILRKIWQAVIRHDPAADLVDWQLKSVPFTRTYSHADLLRADQQHSKKRTAADALPEIYSLGERLRIVGRLVYANGGALIHLTKTLNSLTFEYRGPDNAIHQEEYSAEDLYRLQRQYYAQREAGGETAGNPSSALT